MVANFPGGLDHTAVMDVELTCTITGGSTGEEGGGILHCIY